MSEDQATEIVNTLYESWYAALLRYASGRLGTIDGAQDLVQEAFLLLYRELRSGIEIDNPRGWTLTVVRRQASRRLDSQRRDVDLLRALRSGESDVAAESRGNVYPGSDLDDARKLLSVLTPREREVIFLRLASMKYREIAASLEISANSVNTLLARALRKLRKAYRHDSSKDKLIAYEAKLSSKTLQ